MATSAIPLHRLDLIEQELNKALSEGESAMDRLKFLRALVAGMKSQIEFEDEATIPVLDVELPAHKEYRRR